MQQSIELTDEFLAQIAGWDVIKQGKALVACGKVLSSEWNPPTLRGQVQEGGTSFRSGLVIKDKINIENLCTCRASRAWGTICAHSVAVGLHQIRSRQSVPLADSRSAAPSSSSATPRASTAAPIAKPAVKARVLQRATEPKAGEPAAIHVILPPNFVQAIDRGKVMVCFEGEAGGRRSPLNSFPLDKPFRFTPEDAELLTMGESLAGGDTPAMLMLTASDLARLLSVLNGHPRVTLGKNRPVQVNPAPASLRMSAELAANGEILLTLTTGLRDAALIKSNAPGAGPAAWLFAGDSFRPLPLPFEFLGLIKEPLRISRAEAPIFLSQHWEALRRCCELEANFSLDDFEFQTIAPRFRLQLTGGLAHLVAQLEALYPTASFVLGGQGSPASFWLPDPEKMTRYATRDFEAEQKALARLIRWGFTGPHEGGVYQLAGQNQVLNFFARDFHRLQKEWEVRLEERLQKSAQQNIERIEPEFQIISSGEQWFELQVAYKGGSERYSAADIQRLLLSGQSHTRLPSGRFAVIDTGAVEELQEVLLDCSPQQNERGYRMHNNQAGFLHEALQTQPQWKLNAPRSWQQRVSQERVMGAAEPPPVGPLESVLRPYQKTGVAWLWFLRRNQFGGILADEMGLGKTLQTLAFLQTTRQQSAEPLPPCLVVCPTSLVHNWAAESARFTPALRSLVLHGSKRHSLFSRIAESDLVITSYALARRDLEQLQQHHFDTIILDEAQHIKNRQTQNAQTVKAIRAEHRLVLTGTPLENSVLDLWSIFDFLMPGYLGAAADFRERYELPIARDRDPQAQARLSKRVRPFLLRRLKRDVASDLPEKLEQTAFCELTPEQQALYQQVLEVSRREVIEAVDQQGLQKSRLLILNALLRLRQICCDPRLLKLENMAAAGASGKTELFSELLEEIIDGGHRVLVFSQFVQMLSLLRAKLDEEKVAYSYLDGSTQNRAEVVREFQSNSGIPVFLISLKAGGVGLNLTGADTVIHFDPWWNPAVEDQATDRAHRIGQKNVVTSYKLITKGTVEEKILNLQARKRELINATLANEEQFAESLNWDELRELLD